MRWFDLNVRHFGEQLRGQPGIGLNYTWVSLTLQGAGWEKERGVNEGSSPATNAAAAPGMLVHLDGSRHRWLPGETARTTCWSCTTPQPAEFTTSKWTKKDAPDRGL